MEQAATGYAPEGDAPRRRLVAWAATAVAVAVAATAGLWLASRPAARVRADARRAIGEGRYAEARALIGRWLEAEPGSAEAHYLRARVAMGQDRPDEVADGLRKAQALGYPREGLALMVAIVASKQGRHDEAEPVLRRAFDRADGPDPLLDEALAKVYIETFDFARAVPVLDRWVREEPISAKPYLWRAEVDRRGGDPGAVARDYREALARDPDLLDARFRLAEELRMTHHNDEAAAEYDIYLARRPDDPAALLGAGRNALERGDEAAGARRLARALEVDPRNAQARRELAELTLRRGDAAGALALFDRAVESDPNDLQIRYDRSLALARLGRTDEANAEREVVARLRAEGAEFEQIRRRLAANPRDAALECRAARWMFDHGHPEEGVRWAEKALRDRPGDAEACRLLADHYDRAGETARANYYRSISSIAGPDGRPMP